MKDIMNIVINSDYHGLRQGIIFFYYPINNVV